VYIESIPNRNSPLAILLREGYREGGKVLKRTLANLSHWDPQLVEHFRVLLKGGVAVESACSVLSIGSTSATCSSSAASTSPASGWWCAATPL